MISNIESIKARVSTTHCIYTMIIRYLSTLTLIVVATACVTTGGEKKQVEQVVKKHCDAAAVIEDKQAKPGEKIPEMNNCLPRGVIEISENYGVDPEVRKEFDQAVILLQEEKYSEAIRILKGVSGKTSKFSAPYINLGIAYERTNELEKAEENFKHALEINKLHPVAQNELGMVYRRTGRYTEAQQLYQSLLAMYPDFLPARKNYGVLCDIYIQDLNCALEQYQEYLKGIPDDEKVKIWVADVKSRM